ncbi:MAG: hypothetical protein U9Q27_01340, partial [Patescibacteria group bacterium]|nr:hypothetical protein [Patescibacteria group bacterium]
VDNCFVDFNKSIFKNNRATIYFNNALQSEIRDCDFINNGSSYSCLKIEDSNVSIYNSNFSNNYITIKIIGENPVLSNVVIENSSYCGIIVTDVESCPDLSGVTFNNNENKIIPTGCE